MCDDVSMSKIPKEAMDFLSYVAKFQGPWDEPHGRNTINSNLCLNLIQKEESTI